MTIKIFFSEKNHTENEDGRLVPDLISFLRKLNMK